MSCWEVGNCPLTGSLGESTSTIIATSATNPFTTSATTFSSTASSTPPATFTTSTTSAMTSMTASGTFISTPTAPRMPSSTASSATTDNSDAHRTPLILAITLPLALLIIIAVVISLLFRRRTLRARRTNDHDRRAEWLDPSYVSRVRDQMMAMDPSKIGPGYDDGAPSGHGTNIDSTELSVWDYQREAAGEERRANDTANGNFDDLAGRTYRGNMSGSVGRRVQQPVNDEQAQPDPRLLSSASRTRTRTTTTEEGSPVHVPFNFGQDARSSFDRRGDSNVDLGLQRAPWSPLDDGSGSYDEQRQQQQLPVPGFATDSTLRDSPSEGEWLSSPATMANMEIPPPVFDPRGAIIRESQIGLALPFPPQEETHEEGQFTGDGYESAWQSRRRRGPGADLARPQGGILEALPGAGLEVGESSSCGAADAVVDTRPPMRVEMAYPLLADSAARGLSVEERSAALWARVRLLQSVRQRTAADDEEDRREEEQRRHAA